MGEVGGSDKRETLALGETPNVAARLQALAEPDTLVISPVTQRLVSGLFTCRSLGLHEPKGLTTPLEVYQVLGESGVQSRFEVALSTGLTPLVGRDLEVGLLRERWEQAKQGAGQMVLLSGEAGIGKSRLLQAHEALGATLFFLGELAPARVHLEQGITLYDPQKRRSRALQDPGVDCRVYASLVLWHLGCPD